MGSERRARGLEMMKKVYAGDVPVPPEGASPFADIMLEQVFAEVWTRAALSVRDRRLLIMGVIACMGESMTWGIQAKAALKNGELTPEQLREALIQLAQYAGYPRAAGLMAVTEQTIAEFVKSRSRGGSSGTSAVRSPNCAAQVIPRTNSRHTSATLAASWTAADALHRICACWRGRCGFAQSASRAIWRRSRELAGDRASRGGGLPSAAGSITSLRREATQSWRWGQVGGKFVTTLQAGAKACHPESAPSQVQYLKEGAPDAYAKVLAYHLRRSRMGRRASHSPKEARKRVLDLVDTPASMASTGPTGARRTNAFSSLASRFPVWIETALLLADTPVWSGADRASFARWLADTAYPKVAWASRVRRNNWGAAGSLARA